MEKFQKFSKILLLYQTKFLSFLPQLLSILRSLQSGAGGANTDSRGLPPRRAAHSSKPSPWPSLVMNGETYFQTMAADAGQIMR